MADKKETVRIEYLLDDKASSGLGVLAGKVLGVVGGITALIAGIKGSLEAYSEQEDAIASLNQALLNNNDYTIANTMALQDQAGALQKTTAFADEQIMAAQAQLAMYGLSTQQIQKVTEATLDFAQAQGISAADSASLIGKAIGTSTNALGRYGIEVAGAVGSTDRLNSAIVGLSAKFGGQAAAYAATYSGSIAQMKNAMGELGEVLGGMLAPGIQQVAGYLTEMSYWLKGISETEDFQKFIEGMSAGIDGVVQNFSLLFERIQQLHDFFLSTEEKQIAMEERQKARAEAEAARQKQIQQKKEIDDKKKAEKDKKDEEERLKAYQSSFAYIENGTKSSNKTVFEIGKAAGIANATIDAYVAYNKALASAPPPFNYILAGATLAVGVDTVSRISNQQIALADGGIINAKNGGVTAQIAEANGNEAVLPLDSQAGKSALREAVGGGNTVVVNIDGRALASHLYTVQKDMIRTGEIQP